MEKAIHLKLKMDSLKIKAHFIRELIKKDFGLFGNQYLKILIQVKEGQDYLIIIMVNKEMDFFEIIIIMEIKEVDYLKILLQI